MADLGIGTAVGFVVGVIAYALNSLVGEAIRAESSKRRQIAALAVDCLGTARLLKMVVDGVAEDRGQVENLSQDLALLRKLRSGWVLSKPAIGIGIIEFVERELGMLVVRYFDKWERLLEYERRYTKTHDALLMALTTPEVHSERVQELWSQTQDNLEQIEKLARGLAILAIDIYRKTHDDSGCEPEIPMDRLSDGAWSDRWALDATRADLERGGNARGNIEKR